MQIGQFSSVSGACLRLRGDNKRDHMSYEFRSECGTYGEAAGDTKTAQQQQEVVVGGGELR